MSRIFLLLAVIVGLAGCSGKIGRQVAFPAEVTAVTQPFLAAVRRGDQAAAEKFVSPGFVDDSRVQFAEMSALLKKSPSLAPAMYQPKATTTGPNRNEVMLTFAAKDGKKWVLSEIRLYRRDDQPYMIEYWDVDDQQKQPSMMAHVEQMQDISRLFMAALAITSLFALGLLIWIVKRRTYIISPDPAVETRRVATTVRDL
jgi:hypothetical protein